MSERFVLYRITAEGEQTLDITALLAPFGTDEPIGGADFIDAMSEAIEIIGKRPTELRRTFTLDELVAILNAVEREEGTDVVMAYEVAWAIAERAGLDDAATRAYAARIR